jgi:hypothetical protein
MPIYENGLIPPSEPPDVCNMTVWQAISSAISGTQIKSGVEFNNLIISRDFPTVNQRDKAWWRLNSDLSPGKYLYKYFSGFWIAEFPIPTTTRKRYIFIGEESQLWSEDDGDGQNPDTTPVTELTGSFWDVDEEFAGRYPQGAGAFPGVEPPVTIQVANNYGTGQFSITPDNMIEHWHYIMQGEQLNRGAALLGPSNTAAWAGGGFGAENYVTLGHDDPVAKPANVGQTSKVGKKAEDVKPIPMQPPSRGVFFIKRTNRRFVVAK